MTETEQETQTTPEPDEGTEGTEEAQPAAPAQPDEDEDGAAEPETETEGATGGAPKADSQPSQEQVDSVEKDVEPLASEATHEGAGSSFTEAERPRSGFGTMAQSPHVDSSFEEPPIPQNADPARVDSMLDAPALEDHVHPHPRHEL